MSWDKDSILVFTSVDDTDIVKRYLTRTEITIEDIYISMHKSINRWEGVLKSTRGAIRPNKSFVFPISFKYDDQGDY